MHDFLRGPGQPLQTVVPLYGGHMPCTSFQHRVGTGAVCTTVAALSGLTESVARGEMI